MKECPQNSAQSVWCHGLAVREKFDKLINCETIGFRLPDWFFNNWISKIHPRPIWEQYTLFHDCGKPACRTVDSEGRVHFPDHAKVSRQTWEDAGGCPIVGRLIGWDMCIHTSSAEEIELLCREWTEADAATLLLASLAEIHANAEMFGGIESVSFKSKWKTIDRRGRQIVKFFTKEIQ